MEATIITPELNIYEKLLFQNDMHRKNNIVDEKTSVSGNFPTRSKFMNKNKENKTNIPQ